MCNKLTGWIGHILGARSIVILNMVRRGVREPALVER